MADPTDLVRRCREFAALAEGTRPGPWHARRHMLVVDANGKVVADAAAGYGDATRNGPLIAAAPEMARLLAECAEALASAQTLAFEAVKHDGAHHKQWYLERILEATGMEDLPSVRAIHEWQEGVAP